MVGILLADVPSMLSFFVGIRARLVTHLCREKSPFLIPNWTKKNMLHGLSLYFMFKTDMVLYSMVYPYIPWFILMFLIYCNCSPENPMPNL